MGTLRRRRYRALLGCIALLTCSTAGAQVIDLPDVDVTASRLGARVPRTPARERTPRAPTTTAPVTTPATTPATTEPAAPVIGTAASGIVTGTIITGASSTVITSTDIARSPGHSLQDLLSREPGVQVTNLFGGVNGARSQVDMRGFGAAAALEHASAHQWPAGHGSRPGGVRHRIDPARVHRARRDHPRQQRRGALWRRSGGRRDQHRDQDRRCLADAERGSTPPSARSTTARAMRRSPARRAPGRRASTATRSTPTAIASTTSTANSTASPISAIRSRTPAPTSICRPTIRGSTCRAGGWSTRRSTSTCSSPTGGERPPPSIGPARKAKTPPSASPT